MFILTMAEFQIGAVCTIGHSSKARNLLKYTIACWEFKFVNWKQLQQYVYSLHFKIQYKSELATKKALLHRIEMLLNSQHYSKYSSQYGSNWNKLSYLCKICDTGSLTIITFDYTWATCYIKVQSVLTEPSYSISSSLSLHCRTVSTRRIYDENNSQFHDWRELGSHTRHISRHELWSNRGNLLPSHRKWGDPKSSEQYTVLSKRIEWLYFVTKEAWVAVQFLMPHPSRCREGIYPYRLSINRQNRPIMCLWHKHVSLHNTFTFWTHLKVVRSSTS